MVTTYNITTYNIWGAYRERGLFHFFTQKRGLLERGAYFIFFIQKGGLLERGLICGGGG